VQFLDRALRCLHAVVATVERPRTAEDTVPWTAPAEFDGSSRIELAYEIFSAMPNDIARRQEIIQRFHEVGGGRDDRVLRSQAPPSGSPIFGESIQQAGDRGFAFANQHAIHTPAVCRKISSGMNETLCPPNKIKAVGNKAARGAARSIISGTLAR